MQLRDAANAAMAAMQQQLAADGLQHGRHWCKALGAFLQAIKEALSQVTAQS